MLSLQFPNLMTDLKDAGPGVFPFRRSDGKWFLVVKGNSDLPLAAKLTQNLKFHLYDITIDDRSALGVMTAAYDRESAPIVVRTICSDPFNHDLVETITQDEIEIGFFDMHNSEVFSGRWSLAPTGPIPDFVYRPVPSDYGPTLPLTFQVEMQQRFQALDGGFVIEALLTTSDVPDNLAVLHVTDEALNSRFDAGLGIFSSQLEVHDSSGSFQEPEIARLLSVSYGSEKIFLNPETDRRPEFCDILAVGDREAICIHAKSVARTAARAAEDDQRRRLRLTKHFEKAIKQACGCERAFYKLGETVTFKGRPVGIGPGTHLLLHIILLPEKHGFALGEWSKTLRSMNKIGAAIVVLDKSELDSLVTVFRDRDLLVRAIFTIYESYESDSRIGDYVFSRDRVAVFLPN